MRIIWEGGHNCKQKAQKYPLFLEWNINISILEMIYFKKETLIGYAPFDMYS